MELMTYTLSMLLRFCELVWATRTESVLPYVYISFKLKEQLGMLVIASTLINIVIGPDTTGVWAC
jgi:hypothetical protein